MPHGGKLVAQALQDEGVKTVFTLCGGHVMPIYDGCVDLGIRVVDVRHEQAAAMAADGLARVTGRPQAAIVTAGPGVMNAITGIANARKSDSPLVTIGGQAELTRYDQGALQDGPQLPVVTPITKWARGVYEAKRLHEYTRSAFRIAASPRTGPTYLEVPWDVLFQDADDPTAAARRPRPRPRATAGATDAITAVDLLSKSERPIVLAGGSVHWCGAAGALTRLAEALDLPVFTNGLARGAMPAGHPLSFSLARGHGLANADLVVVAGTPWDFRLGYGEDVAPGAKVLHIDVDAESVGHNRMPDVALVGDLDAIFQDLRALWTEVSRGRGPPRAPAPTGAGRAPARKAWLAAIVEEETRKRAKMRDDLNATNKPVHSLRLAKELDEALPANAIVVGDGGNVVANAAKVLRSRGPGSWLDPGPFGTLGVGLPFAMAAKLNAPDRPVVLLSGDGSFGLNGFELDTCVRHDIPVVVVVGNDRAWAQIRQPQVMFYGDDKAPATLLGDNARYDKFAEAMGGLGYLVDDPADVAPTVKKAIQANRPAVVNVLLDPETNKGSGKAM
ncbi:MAG TPA: thiamine pyrophosphate-binding protein [Candidatus Thermoplasmatota archaeon]|nr:thiamine pyrophosphate-binding protein [Candidatus Thermoplasmatota archaeon]